MAAYDIVALRAFSDNYIWTLRDATHAAVVDPGEAQPVLDHLEREGLQLAAILNTHHHADHVGGNAALLAKFPVPVYGPRDERIPETTHPLAGGQRFTLPHFGIEFTVLDIPAHTRTHIAFHGDGLLFCGDTLFAAGCGRLFEGTPRQMHEALTLLAKLPDSTRVYCGHEYTMSNLKFARAAEPDNVLLEELTASMQKLRDAGQPTLPSTIAVEKASNPFIRVTAPGIIATASARAGKPLSDPVSVLAEIRDWKNNF